MNNKIEKDLDLISENLNKKEEKYENLEKRNTDIKFLQNILVH